MDVEVRTIRPTDPRHFNIKYFSLAYEIDFKGRLCGAYIFYSMRGIYLWKVLHMRWDLSRQLERCSWLKFRLKLIPQAILGGIYVLRASILIASGRGVCRIRRPRRLLEFEFSLIIVNHIPRYVSSMTDSQGNGRRHGRSSMSAL